MPTQPKTKPAMATRKPQCRPEDAASRDQHVAWLKAARKRADRGETVDVSDMTRDEIATKFFK